MTEDEELRRAAREASSGDVEAARRLLLIAEARDPRAWEARVEAATAPLRSAEWSVVEGWNGRYVGLRRRDAYEKRDAAFLVGIRLAIFEAVRSLRVQAGLSRATKAPEFGCSGCETGTGITVGARERIRGTRGAWVAVDYCVECMRYDDPSGPCLDLFGVKPSTFRNEYGEHFWAVRPGFCVVCHGDELPCVCNLAEWRPEG